MKIKNLLFFLTVFAGFLASYTLALLKLTGVIGWGWFVVFLPVILAWGIPLMRYGLLAIAYLFLKM